MGEIDDLKFLLESAAQGDDIAFEKIVGIFNGKMLAMARIYVHDSADDIVQTVWMKIVKNRSRLSVLNNIDNWLFYIVRNQCFDYLKKCKDMRTISLEENEQFMESITSEDDILASLVKKESEQRIVKMIRTFEDAFSVPMMLYYFEQLPLADISKILNLPYSTVKWRLHIGRQKLKKQLTGGCKND